MIWMGTLAIFEGTELHTQMEQGSFIPATEMGILEEEKTLIRNIELEPTSLVEPLTKMGYAPRETDNCPLTTATNLFYS